MFPSLWLGRFLGACVALSECALKIKRRFLYFYFVLRCSAYYFRHVIIMSILLVTGCCYM